MKKNIIVIIVGLFISVSMMAQNESLKDSTKVEGKTEKKSDRNLMLNAESNSQPRSVNIGLPGNVGGITIYENGLPLVYYGWPELPYFSWASDASINRVSMMGMSDLAITDGDVGYALSAYDNVGTDDFHLNGALNSTHFGLVKGSFNISGPLAKGWNFSVGGFLNRDPRTYDLGFTNYTERTDAIKAAITKKFNKGNGQISFLYKYNDRWAVDSYAPFTYNNKGEVKELDNFRIGLDSYVVGDGNIYWKDCLTGEGKNYDLKNTGVTKSHNFYVFGNYNFSKDLTLNYSAFYHNADVSMMFIYPTATTESTGQFTYLNSGEAFNGTAQMMFAELIPNTPIHTLLSKFELKKKAEKNNWTFGLNEWHYNVNKFHANTAMIYQEVAPQPKQLAYTGLTDENGGFSYNSSAEYHNGTENKLAVYVRDTWKANNRLTLNYGVQLMYHKVKGDYNTNERGDYALNTTDFTPIDKNFFYKRANVSGYYLLGKNYGLTAEVLYNEEKAKLENYGGVDTPELKRVQTPMGQFGLYWNGSKVNLVSSLTYIKKTNYQTRTTLYNPNDDTESYVQTIYYDIQTLGWTTDMNINLFKNFSLHYLLTVQSPQYKNYSIYHVWDDGSITDKDFSDNTVTEVPKVLMEIDPSYSFLNNKARVWVSARYYSKQYENIGNAIYFAPHWETFGGVNYKINKNFDFAVSATNLLNQSGAKGSVSGADLYTSMDDVDFDENGETIIAGSYILPFTCKFDLTFHF